MPLLGRQIDINNNNDINVSAMQSHNLIDQIHNQNISVLLIDSFYILADRVNLIESDLDWKGSYAHSIVCQLDRFWLIHTWIR